MIQFILMLLGLAFGHNNAHTATCNDDNNGQPTTQFSPGDITDPDDDGLDPGTGGDGTGGPGNGGSTGGNTGQNPPPLVKP